MIQRKINASIVYQLFFALLLSSSAYRVLHAAPSFVPISTLSENICIRICCIARLKQLMGHIEALCESKNCAAIAVDSSLLKLWNDFASFRFVDDLEFQTMFLRKAFSAAISLVNSAELSRSFKGAEVGALSLEYMLKAIDMCTDILNRGALYYKVRSDFGAEQYYIKENIRAESVTRRFFQIRRLRHAVVVLQKLTGHKVPLRDDKRKSEQNDVLEKLLSCIEHPRILDAITSMIESNNTASLLAVADEMTRFRFIGDDTFFQEMLLIMFNAYKSILMQYMHDAEVQARIGLELGAILYMYEQIDQLSLEELLEGIDMATEHMNVILDDIHTMRDSWLSQVEISSVATPALACLGALIAWDYYR